MCFPCCDFCYQKYVDKDGVPDADRFYKILVKHDTKLNAKIEGGVFMLYRGICNCDCHKDGKNILH